MDWEIRGIVVVELKMSAVNTIKSEILGVRVMI